jgi:hypothetical protein
MLRAWLVVVVVSGASGGCGRKELAAPVVPLQPDRELKLADQPLSASTQSVNRYRSVLSRFDAADLLLDGNDRLRVRFREHGAPSEGLSFENVDARFLFPALDYPHEKKLSAFDRANLMLAEYSRNGVELAHQARNREYGYFASRDLFNEEEEYRFTDGKIEPNPGARPKRMSLVNNCLMPGLWEVSAVDSVGELYHAWLALPEKDYLAMLARVDRIEAGESELRETLAYKKELEHVPVELDRLRTLVQSFGTFPVAVNVSKAVASYSTQDSRRKVQRKFYRVERDGTELEPRSFAELRAGDTFRFFSFVPPGIYTNRELRTVEYEPIWTRAELAEVVPKTRFEGQAARRSPLGSLEITLHSADGKRALVVGNLPIDLLVEEEDYDVPGFGVGVLRASEPIERRYLFLKDGPAPVYAYSTFVRDGRLELANNHEQGLEQIYLRTVRRGTDEILRITLVAYERIVDLLELELVLPPELAKRVQAATAAYRRPLWRSFSDTNLL